MLGEDIAFLGRGEAALRRPRKGTDKSPLTQINATGRRGTQESPLVDAPAQCGCKTFFG
jgi:hypothetical protein